VGQTFFSAASPRESGFVATEHLPAPGRGRFPGSPQPARKDYPIARPFAPPPPHSPYYRPDYSSIPVPQAAPMVNQSQARSTVPKNNFYRQAMKPWVLVAFAVVFLGIGWFCFRNLGRAIFPSKAAEARNKTPKAVVLADVPRPEPVLPRVPPLPAGERFRMPSVDVNQQPPLPLLTPRSVSDRASLEDPTTEVSANAALSAALPQRTRPVPFLRLTIPDPFANRRPVQMESALPERNHPPVTLPKTP
jgi:hypothetical protein